VFFVFFSFFFFDFYKTTGSLLSTHQPKRWGENWEYRCSPLFLALLVHENSWLTFMTPHDSWCMTQVRRTRHNPRCFIHMCELKFRILVTAHSYISTNRDINLIRDVLDRTKFQKLSSFLHINFKITKNYHSFCNLSTNVITPSIHLNLHR